MCALLYANQTTHSNVTQFKNSYPIMEQDLCKGTFSCVYRPIRVYLIYHYPIFFFGLRCHIKIEDGLFLYSSSCFGSPPHTSTTIIWSALGIPQQTLKLSNQRRLHSGFSWTGAEGRVEFPFQPPPLPATSLPFIRILHRRGLKRIPSFIGDITFF